MENYFSYINNYYRFLLAYTSVFFSIFMASILSINAVKAEVNFNLTIFEQEDLRASLGDIGNFRISFIDQSENNDISISEITLDGKVKKRIPIDQKKVNVKIKSARRVALDFQKITKNYIVAWPDRGITFYKRDGFEGLHIPFPKITHDIQISDDDILTFANAWSQREEPQAYQINTAGEILWSWNAADFIDDNNFKKRVNRREPPNFAAATSAVDLGNGQIAVTLSAWGVIALVDRETKLARTLIQDIRPHAVVVRDGDVIGYTARKPNTIVIKPEGKQDFVRIPVGGIKSLDLQYLGRNLWLTPTGPTLKIVHADSRVLRQIEIDMNKLQHPGRSLTAATAFFVD